MKPVSRTPTKSYGIGSFTITWPIRHPTWIIFLRPIQEVVLWKISQIFGANPRDPTPPQNPPRVGQVVGFES